MSRNDIFSEEFIQAKIEEVIFDEGPVSIEEISTFYKDNFRLSEIKKSITQIRESYYDSFHGIFLFEKNEQYSFRTKLQNQKVLRSIESTGYEKIDYQLSRKDTVLLVFLLVNGAKTEKECESLLMSKVGHNLDFLVEIDLLQKKNSRYSVTNYLPQLKGLNTNQDLKKFILGEKTKESSFDEDFF